MTNKTNFIDRHVAPFLKVIKTPLAIILIFAVSILLIAAMYDGPSNPKSPAGKFVYNYQALIAGILAVIASAATIRQMKITDARQDREQSQTRKFMMLPIVNTINKHALHNHARMKRITDMCNDFNDDAYKKKIFREKALILDPVLNCMIEFINEYEDGKGLDLYSAKAREALQILNNQKHEIQDALQALHNITSKPVLNESSDSLLQREKVCLVAVESIIRNLQQYYKIITDNLSDLVDEYVQ